MTPLSRYAARFGATIRAHPATEPIPGVRGGVVVVVPTGTWRDVDDLLADPRTDTTAALLVAPGLQRDGFVPNVVATTSVFTPAVPADGLLSAVEACMADAEAWRVRARSVAVTGGAVGGGVARNDDNDDDEDLTLDLVAEYRVGRVALALSSLVRVRNSGGVTVLWQTHVTTLADQISQHSAGLAAARVG